MNQTVTARTEEYLQHWFAPVIGIDQSRIVAEATAQWGPPKVAGGLPLTFNVCTFEAVTGGEPPTEDEAQEFQIALIEPGGSGETPPAECDTENASNFFITGGFDWLITDEDNCLSTYLFTAGEEIAALSDPGASAPQACKKEEDLAGLRTGEPILIPIFDSTNGAGGAKGEYHLLTFAAFRVTAYDFGDQKVEWLPDSGQCQVAEENGELEKNFKCPDRWIQGYFLKYVTLADGAKPDPGVPDYGVTIVALTG